MRRWIFGANVQSIKNVYSSLFLVFLILVSGVVEASSGVGGMMIKTRNPQPNVIWLSVDDIGNLQYDALESKYGQTNPLAKYFVNDDGRGTVLHPAALSDTPNLNRMLRAGVSFDAFTVGNQCGQTRGMLLYGTLYSGAGVTPPLNSTAPTPAIGADKRIADSTDYVIYQGGKSQFGTGQCALNWAEPQPLPYPWAVADDYILPSASFALESGADFCVGAGTLYYQMEAHIAFPVLSRNSSGGFDQSKWIPPTDLGLVDGYMHVDEMMTYHSIETMKSSAYARPDGSAGDPQSLWDNHYNKPFFIHLGYHSLHNGEGDLAGNYKGYTSPQGYWIPAPNNKTEFVSTNGTALVDITPSTYNPPRFSTRFDYATAVSGGWPLTTQIGFMSSHSPPWVSTYTDCGYSYPDGEFYEELYSTTNPWGYKPGKGKASFLGPYQDCLKGSTKFVDNQIGHYLDALGSAGMANTLIIFTGDNGQSGSRGRNIRGTNYLPGTTEGQGPGHFGSDPDFAPDISDFAIPDPLQYGGGFLNTWGKQTVTETGFNVPLVMMGGWLNRDTYGSRSTKRLNGADITETLIQIMSPSVTPMTPDGRDFSSLLRRDCHNGNCDEIADTATADWTYTSLHSNHGMTYKKITDITGTHQYSFTRQSSGSGCPLKESDGGPTGCGDARDRCDWVIDLLSDTPWEDLRIAAITGTGHPSLPAIYASMDTLLTARRASSLAASPPVFAEGGQNCSVAP